MPTGAPRRWVRRLAVAWVVLTPCLRAGAEPEAAPRADTAPPDARLEQAKALFRAGLDFLNQKQIDQALELFLKSRALFPSRQNTINAAICLEALGRDDEALALYEAALIEFPAEITAELRAEIAPTLERLRGRVGSVDIFASVNGVVIVDGRERGTLPLLVPLRVLAGERTIRVIKDGYETFERRVRIAVGQTLRVDAPLKPLTAAGRLRVDAPGAEGAELRIDGALVGRLPWEGTLAPGKHRYEALLGDTGTGPASITVLQGQTVSAAPTLQPLGRTVRLLVSPPDALLSLDGERIETGWQGRLTVGTHELSAREEGYFPGARSVAVSSVTSGNFEVVLRADPEHLRWAKPSAAIVWFEGFGGYALAPSLGSDAESCSRVPCASGETATGFLASARAAYEFPVHLSLEVAAGYLALRSSISRSSSQPFDDGSPSGSSLTYRFDDEIELRGVLASGGVGFRGFYGKWFGVQARLHFGVLFGNSVDTISARIESAGDSTPARAVSAGIEESSVSLVVEPELQAQMRFGSWRFGAGLTSLIVPYGGPSHENGDVFPVSQCPDPPSTPLPPECVGGSNIVANERLFGPFVAWVPGISIGYELR